MSCAARPVLRSATETWSGRPWRVRESCDLKRRRSSKLGFAARTSSRPSRRSAQRVFGKRRFLDRILEWASLASAMPVLRDDCSRSLLEDQLDADCHLRQVAATCGVRRTNLVQHLAQSTGEQFVHIASSSNEVRLRAGAFRRVGWTTARPVPLMPVQCCRWQPSRCDRGWCHCRTSPTASFRQRCSWKLQTRSRAATQARCL